MRRDDAMKIARNQPEPLVCGAAKFTDTTPGDESQMLLRRAACGEPQSGVTHDRLEMIVRDHHDVVPTPSQLDAGANERQHVPV
jgi:hypothetical protein